MSDDSTITDFFISPIITEILKSSMKDIRYKLHKYFPSLPKNALKKIYKAHVERLRLLMIHGIQTNIHWLIETQF